MKSAWITALLLSMCLLSASCHRVAQARAADRVDQATKKRNANDIAGAIADFNRAIKLDPRSVDAYHGRGTCKFRQGDTDGAIADFNVALQIDANDARTYWARGYARRQKGDIDGAITDYTKAIELKPGNASVYINRGNARREKEDFDNALQDFEMALEIDPESVSAHVGRANVKRAKGDFEGALADCFHAVVLDPDSTTARMARGLALGLRGDADAALADFERVIQLDPTHPGAHYNRGFAKAMKGDLDGAIAAYARALELDPTYALTYKGRGHTYYANRRWSDAVREFRAYCELEKSEQDEPRLMICLAQSRIGEAAQANQDLAAYLDQRQSGRSGDWASTSGGHLLGRYSETELFAAAKPTDAGRVSSQVCEAWYVAGMKKLIDGDSAAAAERFAKCVDTGRTDVIYHFLAQAEMKAPGR